MSYPKQNLLYAAHDDAIANFIANTGNLANGSRLCELNEFLML